MADPASAPLLPPASMTHSLRALALGLAFALTLTACDNGTDPPDGSVAASGTLENSFDRPVDGATMTFTSDASRSTSASSMPTYTATTGANGSFNLQIPAGSYNVTVTHPAYGSINLTATVSASGQVTFSAPVNGPGGLTTVVVNALNGQGIANATAYCSYQRSGGGYNGGPSATVYDFLATSNASGQINVTGIPYGAVRCITNTEFGPVTIDVPVAATGTTTAPPITAVPLPNVGEYRVILTWGTSPSDLDSHVTGPDGSGGRFHVYYGSSSFGNTMLDLDDTSGSGPETITVHAATAAAQGMYRYSVHNYSDQSTAGAQGIATSPTRVQVYGPQGLLRTYVAPAAASGNTWRVFDLTVQGTSGVLSDGCPSTLPPTTPCAGLGYFQASGSSDTGTFLTGGPGEPPSMKGLAL
jgi:hypothetical protein